MNKALFVVDKNCHIDDNSDMIWLLMGIRILRNQSKILSFNNKHRWANRNICPANKFSFYFGEILGHEWPLTNNIK